jgi:hypothetical protein
MCRKTIRMIVMSLVITTICVMVTWDQQFKQGFARPAMETTHANVQIVPRGKSVIPLNNMSINALAPITNNNVWIAGNYTDASNQSAPFYEQFDGSQWRVIASPPINSGSTIHGLYAIKSNNIWAIGNSTTTDSYNQPAPMPLIEHWNGLQWSLVDAGYPSFGSLTSITALSPTNVWAIGTTYDSAMDHQLGYISFLGTLIEHYDGIKWQKVSSPSPDGDDILSGITVGASNNIWAVGSADVDGPSGYGFDDGYSVLIEHYNGTSWSIVPGMNIGYSQSYNSNNYTTLASVSAINAKDVWAVGSYASVNGATYAVSEHWDGAHWSIVSFQGTPPAPLTAVIALHSNDVWATNATALYNWNGTIWKAVPLSPGMTNIIQWQRLGLNTLVGIGTYHNAIQLLMLNNA